MARTHFDIRSPVCLYISLLPPLRICIYSKARANNLDRLLEEKRQRLLNRRSEGGSLLIPEGPRLSGEFAIRFHNVTYSVIRGPGAKEFEEANKDKDLSTIPLPEGMYRQTLFRNLSFSLRRGEFLGIVGPNGTGM